MDKQTKTREQAMADLEARAAKDREKLVREFEAREAIGVDVSEYENPFVHYGRLWDTAGSLHFRRPFSPSIATGKAPTPELVRDLLKAHPPVPMVRFEDGCVSYRTESGLTDANKERGKATPIHPVHFRVGLNSYDQKVALEWVAMLGADLWRFEVSFPVYGLKLGHSVASAERDHMGRITRIVETAWKSNVPGIQVSRYASGSFDTFPDMILWWHRGADLDIPALVEGAK